ncbi:MAG: hypothetical protein WKF31_00990 [Thermoleophilaceae bacterium]
MICRNEQEAIAALDSVFRERRFGATSAVVEEMLEGEELSLLALCDGVRAVPMAPARDYKRIFDGDEGPNTGGMGSFSPVTGHRPRARPRCWPAPCTSRSSTSSARGARPTTGSCTRG